jgi:DNA (cytosine-5)-methyltransferase 1
MRLLDLFCGAGGAARGYQQAGFHVTGVDLAPQPRYAGDEFIQADALTFDLAGYDAIHASPPCQAFTKARVIHGHEHPDLLTPTRQRLREWGEAWIIENVPGSPMRGDFVLCGSMFGLGSPNGGLIRHRCFEIGWPDFALVHPCQHAETTISVFGHGGHVYHGVEDWREVMGIDWMTRDELAQAIPPAYTHFIGTALAQVIDNARKGRGFPCSRLSHSSSS